MYNLALYENKVALIKHWLSLNHFEKKNKFNILDFKRFLCTYV